MGCYLPLASPCGLANAAHYQCQVSERERGWHTFFHHGGGVQIIKSMKRKVTLGRERSAHSPCSFPVAAHPTRVPLLSSSREAMNTPHHV